MQRARLDKRGRVTLPEEILSQLRPDSEFEVVRDGSSLRLVPVEEPARRSVKELQSEAERYWAETTSEQRAKDFLAWIDSLEPKAPHLPDEALRRESFYD